jgi:hypothetical protein
VPMFAWPRIRNACHPPLLPTPSRSMAATPICSPSLTMVRTRALCRSISRATSSRAPSASLRPGTLPSSPTSRCSGRQGAGRLGPHRQCHSHRTARAERRDRGGDHADQVSPSSRGTEACRQRRSVPVRLTAHRKAGISFAGAGADSQARKVARSAGPRAGQLAPDFLAGSPNALSASELARVTDELGNDSDMRVGTQAVHRPRPVLCRSRNFASSLVKSCTTPPQERGTRLDAPV